MISEKYQRALAKSAARNSYDKNEIFELFGETLAVPGKG